MTLKWHYCTRWKQIIYFHSFDGLYFKQFQKNWRKNMFDKLLSKMFSDITVLCGAEISYLQVKYNRLRNGDEGNWRWHLSSFHNITSLTFTLMYVSNIIQGRRGSLRWKNTNTHIHTITLIAMLSMFQVLLKIPILSSSNWRMSSW